MQWHNIYKKIQKQLNYKNPSKTIFYINTCINCQKHLEEKIFFNSEIINLLEIKADILNLNMCNKQTLLQLIKDFLSKNNKSKTILIMFNDDSVYPYNSCFKTLYTLQQKTDIKPKIKIEINDFCFNKSPYCYIKKSRDISDIDVNEQILFFHKQKICNKKNFEESCIQEHEYFVKNLLSEKFKINLSSIQIIRIFDRVKNYNEYLQILEKIINYKFLIVYYEIQALNSFVQMNNINCIEITNKISVQDFYQITKAI